MKFTIFVINGLKCLCVDKKRSKRMAMCGNRMKEVQLVDADMPFISLQYMVEVQ